MSECTAWEPNDLQRRLLTVLQASDYELSVTDACVGAEISRRVYYDWFDHPEFVQWWRAQAERHFVLRLPRVLANLASGAVQEFAGGKNPDPKPDAALIKLFLERFDKEYAQKSQTTVTARVQVSDVSEAEVDKILADLAGTGDVPATE